jgi:pimeloyl-ACP methyl ester carboxylesterase
MPKVYLPDHGLHLSYRARGPTQKNTLPPLLLIHGAAGAARLWLHQLRDLSQDRRVVALDLPGHGTSDPLPAPTDTSDRAPNTAPMDTSDRAPNTASTDTSDRAPNTASTDTSDRAPNTAPTDTSDRAPNTAPTDTSDPAPNTASNLTVGRYADIVREAIARLVLQNPVCVGHSMGGAIVMEVASKMIRKSPLVPASSSPPLPDAAAPPASPDPADLADSADLAHTRPSALVLASTAARLPVSASLFSLLENDFDRFGAFLAKYAFSPYTPNPLVRTWTAPPPPADPATVIADFRACDAFDFTPRLSALAQAALPTLILWGRDDQMIRKAQVEALAKGLFSRFSKAPAASAAKKSATEQPPQPEATARASTAHESAPHEFVVLAGAGHMLFQETPEQANETIKRFLHRLEQAPSSL